MTDWRKVIKKVRDFSAEYNLLTEGEGLLIGVSGGPDSVLLTEILSEIQSTFKLSCHLAHVNYGLRGKDSDRDQERVEKLAADRGWPLEVMSATDHKLQVEGNFQDWARNVRYQFFSELCDKHGLGKIAVAHHLEDQVETFFLRLLRGSGPTGMAAMRPSSKSYGKTLIRPMLRLTRSEIVDVLDEKRIPYRLDKTNKLDKYRRNQLRRDILPLLGKIQPGFERALGEGLLLMQAEDQFLDDLALQSLNNLRSGTQGRTQNGVMLSRNGLQSLPKSLRLRVLRLVIGELTGGPQSITFHHICKMEDLLVGDRGEAHYDLPGDLLYEQGPHVIILGRKRPSDLRHQKK